MVAAVATPAAGARLMTDFNAAESAHKAPAETTVGSVSQDKEMSFAWSEKLVVAVEPDTLAAESIRLLRGILISQHLQDGRRSLAICSPSRAVGCSFLAANLAVAMSQVGIKTLLVDANLRDPAIHDYIVPAHDMVGLIECLRDDALPLATTIQTVQPALSVLYSGHLDSSAADRIGGNVFKALMTSCVRDYDLTIVDTPCSSQYADARRIASVARYAMVVACRQRTYLNDVHTLIGELEADRTKVAGTYLNDY